MAARHGRIHQRDDPLPSSIGRQDFTSISASGPLATATASVLTSITETFSLSNGQLATVTRGITDSSEFASITSSEAAAAHSTASQTDAASTTKASTTASSTSTAKSTTSNVGTLIPAIVIPIAAVLIISFVAFWLFMRRRTKKALASEPEFVMEGMKEKPRSRPLTANSDSSTKKLVPNRPKEASIDVKEVDHLGMDFSAVKEINIMGALDSRPSSRQQGQDPSGKAKAVPNFSRGPRPNTSGRDSTASPVPSFAQRDRAGSAPGQRNPQSALGTKRPNNAPAANRRHNQSSRAGSKSDQMPSGLQSHKPRSNSASQGSQAGSLPNANARSNDTRPGVVPPSQPTPPGAYNGSSPISSYSPIVKEMPKFGTSPTATNQNAEVRPVATNNDQNLSSIRKPPPSAIKTVSPRKASLTEENMRMARLTSNSRVALSSATSPTIATEEPPTPSPRLPPPATRDAPPTNYNIPLPTHEPPAPASIQARLNGHSITDRRSVVSGLSDDYVDMEVDDNKSDVSSLDEREKWQMETERTGPNQGGLGVFGAPGPRPPLLSVNSESRFSEATSSQYSLGKY